MCIIHEYIQQAYRSATGYAPDYDDIFWRFGEEMPYVNTRTLFHRPALTEVLDAMLAGLNTGEETVARCRQVLTCWIHATDWLAKQMEDPIFLPRCHPQISGQTDQLLRPEILPLYELDEEQFREATGQQDTSAAEYLSPARFRQSERYWLRFMDWLERALRGVSHQCCDTLNQFIRQCTREETLIRHWKSDAGEIRLYMGPQTVEDIDIMEFDDSCLTGYVDEVSSGLYVPVTFRADVHYRNGIVLASFTTDTEVNDPEHPGAADYCSVMDDAITWIREEMESAEDIRNKQEEAKAQREARRISPPLAA